LHVADTRRTRGVPRLGIAQQNARKSPKSFPKAVSVLCHVELEHAYLVSGVDLEIGVPRLGLTLHQDLQPGAVEAHHRTTFELLHVLAVNRCGEISGACDEVNQRAHGDIYSLALEQQPNPIQRNQHPELHHHQPRKEPRRVERTLTRHWRYRSRGRAVALGAYHPLPMDDSTTDIAGNHVVVNAGLHVFLQHPTAAVTTRTDSMVLCVGR